MFFVKVITINLIKMSLDVQGIDTLLRNSSTQLGLVMSREFAHDASARQQINLQVLNEIEKIKRFIHKKHEEVNQNNYFFGSQREKSTQKMACKNNPEVRNLSPPPI